MSSLPLVSILIPAYHERFFPLAFNSALAQTYPNVEIVITDDSPGDATRHFVEQGDWARPVRYQRNPNRDGGRSNFNLCFSLARGEYVKFLCDDDLLAPDCVEKMADVLMAHPEVALVTSHRQCIDEQGGVLPDNEATLRPVEEDSIVESASMIRAVLTSMSNFIGEPTTPLLRRSALEKSGDATHDILSYSGRSIRYMTDVAMWFSALRHGHGAYLAETLSSFRVHGTQSQRSSSVADQTMPNYRLLCRLARDNGLLDETTCRELVGRPSMMPGWATLRTRPLNSPTEKNGWRESIVYFHPKRIPKGAKSALIGPSPQGDDFDWKLYSITSNDIGGERRLTDHFLRTGQFESRLDIPAYTRESGRATRQCTNLWNQLLVDRDGAARPCPRFDPVCNLYDASADDGLDDARLRFLTGRPSGPCADCDLRPMVPLADFVRDNFDQQNDLTKARPDRVATWYEAAAAPLPPRRVLVVGHSAGRAGGEFVALTVVQTLAQEQGCAVTVILARGGELVEEFRRHAEVFVVGEDLPGFNAVSELACRLRMQGVRHAICNTVVTGRYATLLKKLGYQVVSLVHELATSIQSFLPEEDRIGICDHSDTLVFPARFVARSFLDHYPPRTADVRIHPQGIEPDFPRPDDRADVRRRLRCSLKLAENTVLIVGAGSGELRKGADLFLQVARRILADPTRTTIHFVWLGQLDAVLKQWLEHDRHILGLDDRVHLAGLQADLTDYYLGADVFLMTSREDPLPNVVIESMYAGLPVVSFADSGGTPELTADGCGVAVPYLDTDAMAAAVCRLLDDPDAARTIGRQAAQRIESGFRRADYVDFLLSHFTCPIHTVTAVIPGSDAPAITCQLSAIAAGSWRPDALCLAHVEAGHIAIPAELAHLPVTGLALPPGTPMTEVLRRSAQASATELLWLLDTQVQAISDDIAPLLSAFDTPQVVAALSPGHNPAVLDALPPVFRALLDVDERYWLKPHWTSGVDAIRSLARGTPVLALASCLLRRTVVEQTLAAASAPAKSATSPLWFWPLLGELACKGTLAWMPRPAAHINPGTLAIRSGAPNDWWTWWCNAQDTLERRTEADSTRIQERENDRRRLRNALELPATASPDPRPKKDKPQERKPTADQRRTPPPLSVKEEAARYEQAARHLHHERLDKAEAILTDLANQGSLLWQVHFDLGRIAFAREQTDQAIRHFRTAAGLEFSSTNALRNLVAIHTMTQEYGAALATVGLILRRENDPELLEHLRAIVTEAGISLDSLDWISPRLVDERQQHSQTLADAERKLSDARNTVDRLERQLLLKNAGLSAPTTTSSSTPAPPAATSSGPGYCIVCGNAIPAWLPYRDGRFEASPFTTGLGAVGSNTACFYCPSCHSHDRERHLALYLQAVDLFSKFGGTRVLHIAPETQLARLIDEQKPAEYIRGDLHPATPDIVQLNVEALPYPENHFDWAICNHVLEHVGNYRLALRELFRVLKPGGRLLCQTPYAEKLPTVFEAEALVGEQERFLYFGQEDHVRLFGTDIDRLIRDAGFQGTLQTHATLLGDKNADEYGVNEREPLFLFVKPLEQR